MYRLKVIPSGRKNVLKSYTSHVLGFDRPKSQQLSNGRGILGKCK